MARRVSGAAGFTKLRGVKINKVNNWACNAVMLETADGKRYWIEAEVTSIGIPVLHLVEENKDSRVA